MSTWRIAGLILATVVSSTLAGCGPVPGAGTPREIGAVYPLSGSQADGGNELAGVKLAADLINQDGGVKGRQVSIVSEDAPSAGSAPAAVDKLVNKGIS